MRIFQKTIREEIAGLLSGYELTPGELIVASGRPRRSGAGLLVGARVVIQFLPWQKGTSRICDLDVRPLFLAAGKEWRNAFVETARRVFEEAASYPEMTEEVRTFLAQLDAEPFSADELEGLELELRQLAPSGDKTRRLREAADRDGVWRFPLVHLDAACTVRVFSVAEATSNEAERVAEVRTETFDNILQASEPPRVIHEDPFPELQKSMRLLLSSLATSHPIHEIRGRYWKLVGEKHPEGWLTLDLEPLVAETQTLPVEFRDQHCRFQPTLSYRGEAKLLRFARVPGKMLEPLCPEEISDKQIADGFKEQGFAASVPTSAKAESDHWGAPDFFEIVASDQRLQRTKISRHANGIQIHVKAVFPEGQVVGPKLAVKCGGREQVAPLQFDPSLNAWTGELVMQIPFRVARRAQITLHLSPEANH